MDASVQEALRVLATAPAEAFAPPAGAEVDTLVLAQQAWERVTALRVDAVAAVDATQAWRGRGAVSLTGWLRASLDLPGPQAAALARLARVLHTELPLTRRAWWSGRLSAPRVSALARQGLASPARRSAVAAPGGEATLVQVVDSVPVQDVPRVLGAWAHGVDAAGVEAAEESAYEARRLSLAQTFDGLWHLEGLLDPVGGATLAAAVEALIGSQLGRDGESRTAAQIRSDALVELAQHALDTAGTPGQGGGRPRLVVHLTVGTLTGVPGAPGAHLTPGQAGGSGRLAELLGCDGEVQPAHWADGELTGIGSPSRTVPPRLRQAVVARDRGCVFPDCDRPATWCQAHHIRWWSRGGLTELANLCLLCRHHHRVVHTHDLQLARHAGADPVGGDASWRVSHPDGRPWTGTSDSHRRRRRRQPTAA